MKCPSCGGNISLEDKFCPYCGAKNILAMQHARDMAEYKEDYEQTKQEVYASQKRLSAVVVRVIVLVVLIIGIIITAALLNNGVYGIRRDRLEKQAAKNAAEYSKIMDEYLEDQDYLGFCGFCEGKGLRYVDAFDKYEPVIRMGDSYKTCISYMLSAQMPGPYGDRARYIEYLEDPLDSFYKDRMEDYYGDSEKEARAIYEKAYAGMKQQLERCLVTYMGLTEEEAASLEGLSKARRTVLIEEAADEQTE